MYAERVLPHDIEAEESVIGSLVIDGEALVKILPLLKAEDFYRERNRWCYEACVSLFQRGEAVDQATLGYELDRQNRLEDSGGLGYLSDLAAAVPTPLHIEDYAQIVRRTSVLRQLIRGAEEIAALPHLRLRGLMTIAEDCENASQVRSCFSRLRQLGERLAAARIEGVEVRYLSMGMSADFELAIAEGANLVRLGTAIFGPRD